MTSFGDADPTYWVKQSYKGYIIEVKAQKNTNRRIQHSLQRSRRHRRQRPHAHRNSHGKS